MTLQKKLFALTLPLVLLSLGSCTTTTSSLEEAAGNEQWLKPSPTLRAQIEDTAKRLPWTHGMERIDAISWFARVGEPAYPTLLAMVQDPRHDVAGAALAALGATRDSRLVDSLHALPLPSGADKTDLVLERARTLLRLGDWQAVPQLIGGLSDERLITRALCAQALWESTHERFGYDPRAEGEERETSIQAWKAWWQEREHDPLLSDTKPGAAAPTPTTSRTND
ncbi:MAG: hypothetical protein SGI72_07785 [Planctomycetota bacterium]|nr:hypothetical protein [Planctomycetota bacterium]